MACEGDCLVRKKALCGGFLYKVKNGDSIYSITRKYKISILQLIEANLDKNVYKLEPGLELNIPLCNLEKRRGKTPYAVKEGEQLDMILKQFDLDYETLKEYNPDLEPFIFQKQEIIFIPLKI